MDPLDYWTNEELLRFFRSKRTEMSCFHPPYTFLNQLRDDNIIPEDQYKKVINIKSKSKREMGMYELLDWLETERPQNIKLFWSCVFKDHLLQRYPTLRLFRNSLIYDGIQPNAGSLEFNNQPVKVEEPGVEVVETKVEKDNKRQPPEEEEEEVVVVEPEVVVVEPEMKVEKDNKRQPPEEEEEEVVVVEPEVVVVEPEMKVEKDNKRQPPEEEEEVVVVEPEVVVVEPEMKVEKDNKRKAPEEEEVEVEPEVEVVETKVEVVETKVEVVETKVEVVETEVEVETKVEVVETKLGQAPEDVDVEVEKDNKREAPEEGEETGSKKKQKIMGRSIVYELPGSSSSSTQAQMREDLKPTYGSTLQPEKKENKPQLYRPDSSPEREKEEDISMLTKYKTQLPVTCREFSITLYRDKLTLEPEVKKKKEEEAEVEVELETEEDQMYGDGNRPKRPSIYDKTKTVNRNFPVMCANLKGTRSSVREPAEEEVEVEKEEEEPQKDIWNLPKYKTHLPVTCGTLKGMLNRDKMALGEPCILVNGEWVTPPVFMKLVGRGFWKWYVFCQDTRLCQLIKEGHLICPGYQRRKAVHSGQVKAITHWNTLDSSVTETEVEEEKEEEEEEVEEYEDILLKSISLRIAAEEDSSDDAVHMQSSQ